MRRRSVRAGTTLLEALLFLGILGIISGTVIGVLLSTQDARVRQRSIASVEQEGTQALTSVTKMVRKAEGVILPEADGTGTTLLLQMAQNAEFPTIIRFVGSGLVLVQRTQTSSLLAPDIDVSDVEFRNVGGGNVSFSFELTKIIPTLSRQTYVRRFSGTATLFPDDQDDAGGCGSCPAPACIDGRFTWYVCESGICSQSDTTLSC